MQTLSSTQASTFSNCRFLTQLVSAISLFYLPVASATDMAEWKNLVSIYQNANEMTKLNAVNLFFNQIPYIADSTHWGKEDYWATPAELISSNGGDCEDYALAKYITLLKLGVAEEKLRLTYVKILGGNLVNIKDMLSGKLSPGASVNFDADTGHMVLVYYAAPEAEPLVLDNNSNSIKAGKERQDLLPVYSFNNQSTWLKNTWFAHESLLGNADKVDAWRNFRAKLNNAM